MIRGTRTVPEMDRKKFYLIGLIILNIKKIKHLRKDYVSYKKTNQGEPVKYSCQRSISSGNIQDIPAQSSKTKATSS